MSSCVITVCAFSCTCFAMDTVNAAMEKMSKVAVSLLFLKCVPRAAEVAEPTDFCCCTLLFKLLQCSFSCFAAEATKPLENSNFKALENSNFKDYSDENSEEC